MKKKKTNFKNLLERIETDILSGKYHPRERLVETDMIERYGATRAAIRKALKELEIKHLIQWVPNRGAMVSEPDKAEMQDIFQARLVLERFAIDNITVPLAKETLAQIAKHMEDYEKAVNSDNFSHHHTANRMFHHSILLQCGNKVIAEIVDNLKYRAHFWQQMIGRQKRFEQTLQEHRAMYDALAHGDLKELKRLNTEHLSIGYENFLDDFKPK